LKVSPVPPAEFVIAHVAGMTNQWLANEGLIEIKQEWWNVKFLRITAFRQTLSSIVFPERQSVARR
jgi:hypothetical protein